MPRKPLIPPGSVLPEIDLLRRIIERDRNKAGREAPASAEDVVVLADRPE